MKAIIHHEFGAPELLALHDVDEPVPADDEVVIRVHAASLNPYDWHMLTGTPHLVRLQAGIRRPIQPIRGADVCGVVEAVGSRVTSLARGDRAFGLARGSLAELAVGKEERLARVPDGVPDDQAAAVPMAGLTALQALRDAARLRQGQRVLINGASGGVGSFAVQIARAMGAEVIGVCSTANVELVRSLGAEQVVDYTAHDVTETIRDCDVVIDNAGLSSWRAARRVLAPDGVYVMVGGSTHGRVLGNLPEIIRWRLASLATTHRATSLVARPRASDLHSLAAMLADGAIRSVISRSVDLVEAAAAFNTIGSGHTRGKVVVNVAGAR